MDWIASCFTPHPPRAIPREREEALDRASEYQREERKKLRKEMMDAAGGPDQYRDFLNEMQGRRR